MARIFISLSNAVPINNTFKPVCFYEQLVDSFVAEGNKVALFIPNKFNEATFNSENILKSNVDEAELRAEIKAFNPEVVLCFNNANYHDILNVTDCPVIVWDADSYPLWNQRELIKKNLDRYIFFSFAEYYRKIEKEYFNLKDTQSFLIEQGTSLKNKTRQKEFNISFIGSYFGIQPNVVSFVAKHCGKNDVIKLLKLIKENPFHQKSKFISSIYDVEMKTDFECFSEKDLTLFLSSENRTHILLNIADLGLALYGTDSWKNIANDFPSLAACYLPQQVFTAEENEGIYNSSRICININHDQARHGMSWRVPDILATDGCLVSSYSPIFEKRFNGLKIPMFDNPFEARIICQKLLSDEKWRDDIVAASNDVINQKWRWHHRFKEMEQILNLKMTNLEEMGELKILEPVLNKMLGEEKKISMSHNNSVLNFKNKLRYKIWKHLGKKLKKKGIIS